MQNILRKHLTDAVQGANFVQRRKANRSTWNITWSIRILQINILLFIEQLQILLYLILISTVPSGHWSSYYVDGKKNQIYQVLTQVYKNNEWKSLDLNLFPSHNITLPPYLLLLYSTQSKYCFVINHEIQLFIWHSFNQHLLETSYLSGIIGDTTIDKAKLLISRRLVW